MSMTRAEAIERLEKLIALYEMASTENKMIDYSGIIDALKFSLAALRPVSRERVEKVWRGEWEDMRESYNDVPKRRCSRCKSVFIGLDTPFCEVCGAPMTDEAVDIIMRRLEALYEAT